MSKFLLHQFHCANEIRHLEQFVAFRTNHLGELDGNGKSFGKCPVKKIRHRRLPAVVVHFDFIENIKTRQIATQKVRQLAAEFLHDLLRRGHEMLVHDKAAEPDIDLADAIEMDSLEELAEAEAFGAFGDEE